MVCRTCIAVRQFRAEVPEMILCGATDLARSINSQRAAQLERIIRQEQLRRHEMRKETDKMVARYLLIECKGD